MLISLTNANIQIGQFVLASCNTGDIIALIDWLTTIDNQVVPHHTLVRCYHDINNLDLV